MMQNDDSAKRAKLCVYLKGLRDEAIRARADSGIEQIWTEDREYNDGIDDSNRAEKWVKPSTSDGRVTKQRSSKKGTRSTIFLNITKRYVNASAAHVADKLFRSDVSNYGIKPTPVPSLAQMVDDMTPAMDDMGQPMTAPVMDDQGQPVMQPQVINGQPMMDNATGQPIVLPAEKTLTKGDIAKQQMGKAKDAAEKAKTQIDDWLTESGINGQSRHVVLDGAMIGTGVLKGPFPEIVKSQAVLEKDGSITLAIEEKLIPKARRISAWNLYPDPSCGTDIHRGKYIFEDDEINSRLLSELKKDPSYLGKEIDRILEEGPMNAVTGTSRRSKTWSKGQTEIYQIWYYYGYMSKEDLESCGYEFEDKQEEDGEDDGPGLIGASSEGSGEYSDDDAPDEDAHSESYSDGPDPSKPEMMAGKDRMEPDNYPCIVVMVNDTIVKATMSPFDSGRFPYHVFRWEYRDDHWAGVGVARQMRTSQDGVNAAVRMLHDNAGVSGAPILIIDRSKIIPADGVWSVGPHKVYYTADESVDVRQAFTWIIAPSMQAEIMNIIQFWMRMAEEETGMPQLLQGQQGGQEHTLGEAQMLNNNGSSMLRRVTNIYDDDITKPFIGSYYEWLMIHGEDDEAKGDFQIEAMGSSVLIERDANSQLLMQMLGASLNPAYEADPALVFKEFILSQRFDYEKIKLTDEKKKEMASRQPPEDPRIAAAKIMAGTRDKELQARVQSDETMQAQQIEFDKWAKQIDVRLAMDGTTSQEKQELDKLKTDVATLAMKLKVQQELSRESADLQKRMKLADHTVNLHNNRQAVTPPTEPSGRAPNGQGFTR